MNKNKSQKIVFTVILSICALMVAVLFLGYGIALLNGYKEAMFNFGLALVVCASLIFLMFVISNIFAEIWTEDKKKSKKNKEKK